MSRPLRLAGYIVIGILAGLLIAGAGIWLLTRTDWGMERARRFAVGWLDERVTGELRIGRVSGGGLLGGVILHDFGIDDTDGRPFLSTDSVELAYDWKTLVGGSIELDRVVLYDPIVVIEKLPGDTAWNYERIFADTTPGTGTSGRSLILFRDARIIGGHATVRLPFDPADIEEPADTARLIIERVAGGLVRTMRFEDVDAQLDRVIWESPIEPGRLFDIESLEGVGYVWEDPFRVEDARGTLTMRDSLVSFELPQVEFASSRASILGRVVIGADRNRMDIEISSDRLAFGDLQWLYPKIPEEGGGSLDLRIQSQEDGGTLYLARDARLSTPGTQLAGSFGVVVGDSLYFTQVDLRASPLDVALIEQLLPGGLPVDGLLVGTVEISGPLSSLETKGDLRLAGSGAGAGSAVRWSGVLDARNGRIEPRALRAEITDLELALLTALDPSLRLGGRVTGSIAGESRGRRLRFTAALEHVSGGGGRSTIGGGGTLDGQGDDRRLDVTIHASPVALKDLSTYVPALRGMQGQLEGPVHLSGTTSDLAFEAQLLSDAGPVAIEGRAIRGNGAQRVLASATAASFRLQSLWPWLPPVIASGAVTADIAGATLADAAGTIELRADSLRVADAPAGSAVVYATVRGGLLVVDSSLTRSVFGSGQASGTVAIAPGHVGSLEATFTSESLSPLEPYLFESAPADADADPRVSGRLHASARVTGRAGAFDLAAAVRGEDLHIGGAVADRAALDIGVTGIGAGAAVVAVTATADSVTLAGHPVRYAGLDARGRTDSMRVTATAADPDREKLRLAAVLQRGAATRLQLEELRIGGESPWRLARPASADWDGGRLRVASLDLHRAAGGRATVTGSLGWAEPGEDLGLDFALQLSDVPFAELLRARGSAQQGGGSVSGSLRVLGSAHDPLIDAAVAGVDLQYGNVRIDRARATARYEDRTVGVRAEAEHGGRTILSSEGSIPLDLRLTEVDARRLHEALRFTVSADSLPAALPLRMLNGFDNVSGRVDGMVTVAGTSLEPTLSGGFDVSDVAADWSISGVRYRDVTGTLRLDGDRNVRVDVTGRASNPRTRGAAGTAAVHGIVAFEQLDDPHFDLRLTARRAWAAGRRDVEALVTGEVRLAGRYTRPEVSGALAVEEGVLYLDEMYRQYLIVGLELDDPSLLSMVDTSPVAVRPLLAASRNPFLRGLQVRDLQLAVGADSWLRSRDMDVEVTGSIGIAFDRRDEDLRLSGTLNVERGTYTLYYPPLQSRRFQVRLGSIDFPGTPGIDPNLSITAAYKARAQGEALDVLALVSGTLRNPRARLSSDAEPPVSESDLASYLFFGVPTWEMRSDGAATGDVAAVAGLGFRALGPSVLGYASSGLQTLMQEAGLLDYVGLTSADPNSADPQATGLSRMLAGTQLELGRYLHSDVFVGYTQRLGIGRYDPAVRLEWSFLPEYSFELFAEDRLARTPGFGLRQESGLRKVYGFSLFREWGY